MSVIGTGRQANRTQSQISAKDLFSRHRWTVADYHKMGEVGLLSEDARIELIDGELVEMAPIGSEHAGQVNQLVTLLFYPLYQKAIVAGQNPVVLGKHNEPQPDVAVLRWRDDYYKQTHPQPEDLLLLIEVSDTTVQYDRKVKIPLYARHGIPEVWLLDLPKRCLEIYRDPENGEYQKVNHRRTGQVSPERLPDIVIRLADLFPKS